MTKKGTLTRFRSNFVPFLNAIELSSNSFFLFLPMIIKNLYDVIRFLQNLQCVNTTQRLETRTLERFRKHVKMRESFDRVANKVLDEAEANNSEVGQDVKTD